MAVLVGWAVSYERGTPCSTAQARSGPLRGREDGSITKSHLSTLHATTTLDPGFGPSFAGSYITKSHLSTLHTTTTFTQVLDPLSREVIIKQGLQMRGRIGNFPSPKPQKFISRFAGNFPRPTPPKWISRFAGNFPSPNHQMWICRFAGTYSSAD